MTFSFGAQGGGANRNEVYKEGGGLLNARRRAGPPPYGRGGPAPALGQAGHHSQIGGQESMRRGHGQDARATHASRASAPFFEPYWP